MGTENRCKKSLEREKIRNVMGVSKHSKGGGKKKRGVGMVVRIIATSRAVDVRRGNQGRSRVLFRLFLGFLFYVE